MSGVLITGATGFVGQNLSRYLSSDTFDITPVSLRAGVPHVSKAYEAIVHLAGKAHDLKNVSTPEDYYRINYELTRELFKAFVESEAKKFIFISSVKAVADTPEGPLDEEHFPDPKTDYGKSKLMAEEYIRSTALPSGKSFYILRPCMIHGPGNRGNLNLLYNFVSRRLPYPLAAFRNQRSFLSVENLCFIISEILQRADISSGVYNVADDEPLSTAEVVSLLSESLNMRPRLLNIPQGWINTAARIGDTLRLPLTTERLTKLTGNYLVSNRKILLAIGKDLPLTAREGILKTAKSFKVDG